MDAIGFAGVFTNRLDDSLAYSVVTTLWVAARCQNASLCIGARPISEPHPDIFLQGEQSILVSLHPTKAAGFVFKAPSLDQPESIRKRRPHKPNKESAILCSEVGNRQCLDCLHFHSSIGRDCSSGSYFLLRTRPCFEAPWRIGKDCPVMALRELVERIGHELGGASRRTRYFPSARTT